MDTREMSDAQVGIESSMNGTLTEKRPLPVQDSLHHNRQPRVLVQGYGDGAPTAPASSIARLLPIEGLRAYLALWVLAAHALWASGYQPDDLPNLPKLIRMGPLAVDLFILISGFVITLSLDKQRETYLQFISRRFFRLFPVFIALFVVAIPLSQVSLWNLAHLGQYMTPELIEHRAANVLSWWDDTQWNIPLHLLMLHGTIPDSLVKDAAGAFLVPAWSVSLEWQFYLVAPLAYAWAISAKPYRRLALCALCLLLVLAARYLFTSELFQDRTALPFHLEYFFLGAVSYFFYQRQSTQQLVDTAFPVACCLALFLFWISGGVWTLIPIGLWIILLGLLLEHPSSVSSRLVSPLLTNRFVLHLGRRSYSLYLNHILVLIVLQYALLAWTPHLTQFVHFGILLAGTAAVSIALSAVLYRYLEVPGMQAGRFLSNRLAAGGVAGKPRAMAPLRETGTNHSSAAHPAA